MTDTKVAEMIAASHAQAAPRQDRSVLWAVVGGAATLVIGGVVTVIGGLIVAVVGGVAMIYLTQTLDKTDSSALSLSAIGAQLAGQDRSIAGLENEFKQLREELQTARTDPFTGKNGAELEERLEEKWRRDKVELKDEMARNATAIRQLERITSSLPQ